jgi:DNA-binding PadR family transcriptional regulator
MSKRSHTAANDLGRPNEPALLILTSLASGTKHGYALTKDIEEFSGARLGPGTLYGAIARLEERGLITPTPSPDRRQPYRLTSNGRVALVSALEEMRSLAEEGAKRLRLREVTPRLRPSPAVPGMSQ